MGEGSGQHTEHTRERLQNARRTFLTHPGNFVVLCEPPRVAYGGTWDLWSPSGDIEGFLEFLRISMPTWLGS